MKHRGTGVGVATALLLGTLWVSGPLNARDPKPFFVGFASGGEHIVYASHEEGIRVLSVPGLEPVRTLAGAEDGWLASVAVSGNGRWLAADYYGGSLRVWEEASGTVRLGLPKKRPKSWAVYLFHPRDDLLYLFREGQGLVRWDVVSARDLGQVRPILSAQRMALSPDGRYLAVVGTCRLGERYREMCVWGEEEELILAGSDLEHVFGDIVKGARDLVFADARRLVAVGDVIGTGSSSPVTDLSPFDLRVLARGEIDNDEAVDVRGVRSAPREQLEAWSADGRWKVRLSRAAKRLYLFRMEDGEPRLENFAPLP